MSTWGLGTFDDDIARDWLEDLHDSDPLAFFVGCLDLSSQEDLDYLACIGVVCTSEMMHALLLQPRADLPPAARRWAADHVHLPVAGLLPDAIDGLRRVMDAGSEMHQRWQDHGEGYGAWLKRTSDLLCRLERILVGSRAD